MRCSGDILPKVWKGAALALLTVGATFVAEGPAAATVSGGDAEFQVNTFTTGYQQASDVARDVAGNFVVVWMTDTSAGPDGSGESVRAQRFDAAGVPQGSEFQVNTYADGDQRFPAVAMDADGDFVVAWQSFGSAGGDMDRTSVQAQRYGADGVPEGSEFQVNTVTVSSQGAPSVSMDSLGNFVVAWESYDSGFNIKAQRYDASGAAQGNEVQVGGEGVNASAAVALEDDGDLVIVWQSHRNYSSVWDVLARRYDSAGVAQGGAFQVNTYSDGTQVDPAVVVAGDGEFVITWQSVGSLGTDGSEHSVQARRYDATGVAQGNEFQVNTYAPGSQYLPDVASDAAGNLIVTWTSAESTGSNTGEYRYSIRAQRYDSSGVPDGEEFQVNAYTSALQAFSTVAADADGDAVVTWTSWGSTGTDDSVYSVQARLFPRATPEVCDGLDNDQDGTVDNGVTTVFYMDRDGDRHGDPNLPWPRCGLEHGYTTGADADDFDDTDPTRYPGAGELCDALDNDGDGQTDEGITVTFFADADGDEFGDPNVTTRSCNYVPGYTWNDDDCDDGAATTYPNAPELSNSADDDCDGQVDEGLDADGDGLADAIDPDVTAAEIQALPPSAIAAGNKNAFLSRLNDVEQLILAGSYAPARTELQALRLRIDGCSGAIRERPDRNDWIMNCGDQHEIRNRVDSLIASLP